MLTIINYQAKTIWNHNEKPLQQTTMAKILKVWHYQVLVEFLYIAAENIKMKNYISKQLGSFLWLNMHFLFKLAVLWYVF